MIRNLKAIGIAVVAVFAMSALVASAAHATEARVKCGNDITKQCTIKVTHDPTAPNGVFKTKAGNVECEKFSANSGPVTDGEKLSSLTLTELKYEECELGGLVAVVSVPSGCHYTLNSGNTIETGATGSVTVAQTVGTVCEIKITAGACTVTVKPQGPLNSVTYTNAKTATLEEITAHANVEKIKYTTSAGCPGGAGEAEDGKYEETITAKGFLKEGSVETTQTNLTLEDA